MESNSKLYVPKCYGLKRWGPPVKNKVPQGKSVNLTFQGDLRTEQEDPVNALYSACINPGMMGGILNVFCGGGKTTMALYIACKLGKKTLIVVHKDFLLDQWKERIGQFIPSARIGTIKAKIIDVDDKDIVIASLQSLSMKEYDAKVFEEFGTVIVDEVHHTSAEVFSKALRKMAFVYTIGLSATIKRKDGLSKVFIWYLGDVAFQATKRFDQVDVKVCRYYDPDPQYSHAHTIMGGKNPNMAKMINNICDWAPRNKVILKMIHDILTLEPSRKILVLSDRREHLKTLMTKLSHNWSSSIYVGGMKSGALAECENKSVIFATFAIASEGYDQKGLDTLVLASPRSDITQSVGRILRDKECDRVHVPLVIDIVDMFSLFVNQGNKRIGFYKSCKYDIEEQQN
jgi:superfamily II DNA or RNA helicase